jgi:hypothetical protein
MSCTMMQPVIHTVLSKMTYFHLGPVTTSHSRYVMKINKSLCNVSRVFVVMTLCTVQYYCNGQGDGGVHGPEGNGVTMNKGAEGGPGLPSGE